MLRGGAVGGAPSPGWALGSYKQAYSLSLVMGCPCHHQGWPLHLGITAMSQNKPLLSLPELGCGVGLAGTEQGLLHPEAMECSQPPSALGQVWYLRVLMASLFFSPLSYLFIHSTNIYAHSIADADPSVKVTRTLSCSRFWLECLPTDLDSALCPYHEGPASWVTCQYNDWLTAGTVTAVPITKSPAPL